MKVITLSLQYGDKSVNRNTKLTHAVCIKTDRQFYVDALNKVNKGFSQKMSQIMEYATLKWSLTSHFIRWPFPS